MNSNKTLLLVTSILIFCVRCQKESPKKMQSFSSSEDTLVIYTEKHKGTGLFPFGYGFSTFKDTSNTFPHDITYPSNLQDFNREAIKLDFFSDSIFVDILLGYHNKKESYIIDENTNKDLTDDTLRLLKRLDYRNDMEELVKVYSPIMEGGNRVMDSTWVRLGMANGKTAFTRSEHLQADFELDGQNYKIGIQDIVFSTSLNYTTYHSKAALIEKGGKAKDTLYDADYLAIDEIFHLGDQF